jgi:hypothetical protein
MKIPVFVSSPTALNPQQSASRKLIFDQLEQQALEPRALGQFDYPTELPLREVFLIARHCAGGVILGFEQFYATGGTWKRGCGPGTERKARRPTPFPTSWNHLEAGILFGLRLPLLVFREEGIKGGIFDEGVSDVFIHPMPINPLTTATGEGLAAVFRKWGAVVRNHYYC